MSVLEAGDTPATSLRVVDRAAASGATDDAARERIRCSVGVMAHDEEANIGRLLESLTAQTGNIAHVSEVIVVASGCTDRTEDVVRATAERDPRVRLLVQPRREGKASAVNLFLAHAYESVLVLCSADVVAASDALDLLVAPFVEADVGMTACRPVPVDDPARFFGFAAHLLWALHHEVNLVGFKAGEMIAFRKAFVRIPFKTAVDEACIEPVIRGQGYRVRYVGKAVVYNKGPETLRDFLSQRRRIFAGHLALERDVGYRVSTMSSLGMLRLLLRTMTWRPRPLAWTCGVACLEAAGRFLGALDHRRRRDHSVWQIASTTKRVAVGPASAMGDR